WRSTASTSARSGTPSARGGSAKVCAARPTGETRRGWTASSSGWSRRTSTRTPLCGALAHGNVRQTPQPHLVRPGADRQGVVGRGDGAGALERREQRRLVDHCRLGPCHARREERAELELVA